MSGQSIMDRVVAARHSIAGQGLAKSVCKATTEEIMGPKKKHLDYLLQCTNEPNVSIPQLADLLIERAQHSNWVVVFKSLITVHNLMNYGNERFTQYLASNNCTFNLSSFMDTSGVQRTGGIRGYDMSTFIRRYAKYLNDKAYSYRQMAFDFCKVKRGKDDGLLRTMNTEKLLKTLPVLQQQLDSLLEYDCTPNELTNGVINACFMLMFKDLIRLFACYNDGIINLLEKYFDMQKKQCRDALDLYKKFLIRMEKVSEFLKVAENVGIDKGDIPDLAKGMKNNSNGAPSSLLEALDQHLASIEGKKGQTVTTPTSKPPGFATAVNSISSNSTVKVSDEDKRKIIEEENRQLEQLKEQRLKEIASSPATSPDGVPALASTNPFADGTPSSQPSASNPLAADLFGSPTQPNPHNMSSTTTTGSASDDLLKMAGNPFQQQIQNMMTTSNASQNGPSSAFGATPWGAPAQPVGSTTDSSSSGFASDVNFAAAFNTPSTASMGILQPETPPVANGGAATLPESIAATNTDLLTTDTLLSVNLPVEMSGTMSPSRASPVAATEEAYKESADALDSMTSGIDFLGGALEGGDSNPQHITSITPSAGDDLGLMEPLSIGLTGLTPTSELPRSSPLHSSGQMIDLGGSIAGGFSSQPLGFNSQPIGLGSTYSGQGLTNVGFTSVIGGVMSHSTELTGLPGVDGTGYNPGMTAPGSPFRPSPAGSPGMVTTGGFVPDYSSQSGLFGGTQGIGYSVGTGSIGTQSYGLGSPSMMASPKREQPTKHDPLADLTAGLMGTKSGQGKRMTGHTSSGVRGQGITMDAAGRTGRSSPALSSGSDHSATGFDAFGDILQPMVKDNANEPKKEPSLVPGDLDSSLASLAGNLSIHGANQIKTDHQWQPKSEVRRTGGTTFSNQPTVATGMTGMPAGWTGQPNVQPQPQPQQYQQQPGMMAPRVSYPMGMSAVPGGMAPAPQYNMGMGMNRPMAPMGGVAPMAGGYGQPVMNQPRPTAAATVQPNDPFGAL